MAKRAVAARRRDSTGHPSSIHLRPKRPGCMSLPFLTAFDPPATSEGTLDPMGLYQIADQLATRLVPGIRERMQRVRFLTAVAVGSVVAEGLDGDPARPDAA